jgi:hypothetical protein
LWLAAVAAVVAKVAVAVVVANLLRRSPLP